MRPLRWLSQPVADPPPERLYVGALTAMCLLLVAPLLLTDLPPLLDYANHLARMVVLAHPADIDLSRFYAQRWAIIPDLGIDLVLPSLIQVLPVHVAGRLAIGAIVLLPIFGSIAYSHAIFGRRSWWSLGAGLVAWNQASLQGFLNFTLGLGLGLLLAAAWIVWRERYPGRTLILALFGTLVLFFCHLMGLVCFALLIGPYELMLLQRHPTRALGRLLSVATVFAVPVLLYVLSPLGHTPTEATFPGFAEKLAQLLVPFENYSLPLDVVTAVAVLSVLVLGHPRTTQPALLTLALAGLLFLCMPSGFQGVEHLDTRFIVLLGFLLFGGLQPALPRAGAILLGTVFAARMGLLASAWAAHATDVAQLRAVIAPVPPGSTVFLAALSPEEAPGAWKNFPPGRRLSSGVRLEVHMAALLPIERRAWWPFLFDNKSQQPVMTRPPYHELALRAGGVANADALPTANLCGFDYVLLLDADGVHDLAPLEGGRLALLTREGFAALFQVDPARCAGTSGAG